MRHFTIAGYVFSFLQVADMSLNSSKQVLAHTMTFGVIIATVFNRTKHHDLSNLIFKFRGQQSKVNLSGLFFICAHGLCFLLLNKFYFLVNGRKFTIRLSYDT